jgi:hypothetical protein
MNSRDFGYKMLHGCSIFSITVLGLLFSVAVSANQVFTSDCAFGFKDAYGSDEVVCASGDVDTTAGFITVFPEGDVCVVAAGTQASGAGISDVTAGGCNTVIGTSFGGAFFDEPVWLPPLTPGLYDILLDENENGVFDGPDVMGNRFQVGAPVGAVIDVAAIKGSAGQLADKYESMATAWKLMSDSSTAVAIGFAVSSGDVFSAVVGTVSLGLSQFGIDFPTDYNAGVIAMGGKVIAGLAGPLGNKYRDLEADPPDPVFTEIVALDLAAVNTDILSDLDFLPGIVPALHAEYPFAQLGDSSHELAQIGLKNRMAVQAALVAAVTSTFEKYQGAEIAGDDTFTYLQARMLRKYTTQLIENMDATRQALIDYKSELAAAGLDVNVFTAADLQIIRDRIVNVGFTPDEITEFKAGGFSDAAIAEMRTIWSGLALPVNDFSRGGLIDAVVAAIDSEKPVFLALSSQAQAVMDDLAPFLLLQHPSADAGGPYAGTEGVPLVLDGSGSSDPNNDITSYDWDIDLDGVFGDAAGIFPSVSFNKEFAGTIGLRVTDAAGNSSVDYADVAIASVNDPPVITSFTPADLNPSASPGNPVNFSVTAEDPDLDPLSFEWTVDEFPVSTDTVYSYEPLVGETGTRLVKVTVSDGSPFSPDISAKRVVQIELAPLPDVTPPQIQILSPADGAVLDSSPVTVSGTASDDTALASVTVNGLPAAFGGGTFSASVPLVAGANNLTAIATDTMGNSASTSIQVSYDPNDPPAIISTPVLSATEGQLYSYDVDASDPDAGDILTYSLDVAPAGMLIDPNSGLIQWTPGAAQLGLNPVTVRVADSSSAFATQSFSIDVAAAPNSPPQINSLPVLSATEGQLYSYDVDASDPDAGDILTYSLDIAPAGMSIDPSSGLIQWTPAAAQLGLNPVTVRVADGSSAFATQSFSIDVAAAGEAPDAPENLQGRAKDLHVNLAWSGSDTAENFRVFRRLDSETSFSEAGQTVNRVFVDDLPPGTASAEYYVVAENQFGQSGPSGITTVVPAFRRSR